jgi:hypothetical protein
MTNKAQSISVAGILELVQGLSPFDKAMLLSALSQDTDLPSRPPSQTTMSMSMQIQNLDSGGMADVMSAIATSLRRQGSCS